MMHNRTFAALVLGVMLIPAAVGAFPRPAHAIFGVADISFDPATFAQSLISAVANVASQASNALTAGATTESAFSNGSLFSKEFFLDQIAYLLIDATIDSLMQSVINWANSGFEGSPAFVSNLRAHMRDLGDAVADEFLFQLESNNAIQSPFSSYIYSSLRQEFLRNSSANAFAGQRFSLGDFTENPEAFLRGEFSRGGFSAWIGAFRNPLNNPYGSYTESRRTLYARVHQAQENRSQELNRGGGFLSQCEQTTTTAESDTASSTVALGGETSGGSPDDCQIRTPGSIIQGLLNKALGAGVDRYVQADELNEVVSAIVGGLVNRVLNDGLSNAAGGGGEEGGGRNITSIVTNLKGSLADIKGRVNQYKTAWEKIGGAAQGAAQRCSGNTTVENTVEMAEAAAEKSAAALEEIEALEAKIATIEAGGGDQSAALAELSADFQALINSDNMPTGAELAQASIESTNNPNVDDALGQGLPVSLYSLMKYAADGKGCPAPGSD